MDEKRLEMLKKKYLEKRQEKEKIIYPKGVFDVNDSDFCDLLKKYEVVVLDCWAPWCNPCKMVSPIVESASKYFSGKAFFGKVNVDKNKMISSAFDIKNIPTILIFKNENVVDRIVGVVDKKYLIEKISNFVRGDEQ